MSLTLARIELLRGNLMMVISPDLVSKLTNAYYGGNLGLSKNARRLIHLNRTANDRNYYGWIDRGFGYCLE